MGRSQADEDRDGYPGQTKTVAERVLGHRQRLERTLTQGLEQRLKIAWELMD